MVFYKPPLKYPPHVRYHYSGQTQIPRAWIKNITNLQQLFCWEAYWDPDNRQQTNGFILNTAFDIWSHQPVTQTFFQGYSTQPLHQGLTQLWCMPHANAWQQAAGEKLWQLWKQPLTLQLIQADQQQATMTQQTIMLTPTDPQQIAITSTIRSTQTATLRQLYDAHLIDAYTYFDFHQPQAAQKLQRILQAPASTQSNNWIRLWQKYHLNDKLSIELTPQTFIQTYFEALKQQPLIQQNQGILPMHQLGDLIVKTLMHAQHASI